MTNLPRLRTITCTHNKTHRFQCVSARNPPFAFLSKSLGNGTLGCARDPWTSPRVFPEARMGWTDPPDPKTLYTRPGHLSQVSKSGVWLPSPCKSVLESLERLLRTVGPAGTMSARRDHSLRLSHSVPPVLGTAYPAPRGTPVGRSGTPSGSPAELYLREPDLDPPSFRIMRVVLFVYLALVT